MDIIKQARHSRRKREVDVGTVENSVSVVQWDHMAGYQTASGVLTRKRRWWKQEFMVNH